MFSDPLFVVIVLGVVGAGALLWAAQRRKGSRPGAEPRGERRKRLERGLISPDMERRKSALIKMSLISGEKDVTAHAIGAELRNISGDPELRAMAAAALGNLGPQASEALDDLRVALKDRNATVRRAAIDACARIGSPALEAAPELAKCLSDPSPEIRRQSALALAKLGETNAQARHELVHLLEDDAVGDWALKFQAAEYLAQHADEMAALALPSMMRALESPDHEVRRQAPKTIAAFGPAILPMLKSAYGSPRESVRWGVVVAAGRLGIPGMALATKGLHDPEESVRYEAVRALGNIGPEAIVALREIVPLFEDRSAAVGQAAVKALVSIGPDVIAPLTEALRDKGEFVRKPIYEIMGEFGAVALPQLVPLMDSPDARLRARVVGCFGALQRQLPEALEQLRRAESDPDAQVRKEAAFAISRSGQHSTSQWR